MRKEWDADYWDMANAVGRIEPPAADNVIHMRDTVAQEFGSAKEAQDLPMEDLTQLHAAICTLHVTPCPECPPETACLLINLDRA